MYCTECRAFNEDDAKKCIKCGTDFSDEKDFNSQTPADQHESTRGTKIVTTCPRCKTQVSANNKYCTGCGSPLTKFNIYALGGLIGITIFVDFILFIQMIGFADYRTGILINVIYLLLVFVYIYFRKYSKINYLIATILISFCFFFTFTFGSQIIDSLLRPADEGCAKGTTGAIRSAISSYQKTEGNYPETLENMTTKYLDKLPYPSVSDKLYKYQKHLRKKKIKLWKPDPTPDTPIIFEDIDNTSLWLYNNKTGELIVNIDGTEARGDAISSW